MTPSPARRSRKRIALLAVGGLLAVYVLSYAILSANGGYVQTQSGRVRYGFGFAVSDIEQWQPRWAWCQPFRRIDGNQTLRGNWSGYAYAPLILLDQKLVHPTRVMIDAEPNQP